MSLIDSGPFCKKCGCGGDWHHRGCIRGQQRGDTIWVVDGHLWEKGMPEPPVVCLPLMRIPAKPEKGTKYLPEVWKPNG